MINGGQVSCSGPIVFNGIVNGGNATTTSALNYSYTVSSASCRLLVVTVLGDVTNDLITGVTYAGTPMTLIKKLSSASTGQRWAYFFYLTNPNSGSNTVAVTASANCDFILSGAADYTGVSSGLIDNSNSHATTLTVGSDTVSVTTVANNAWAISMVIGFNGIANNAPPTMTAGGVRRGYDPSFGTWAIGDSNGPITPGGTTTSHTWSYPNNSAGQGEIIGSFAP